MSRSIDVPELAIVRALCAGGPFSEGELISVAFNDSTVGRLVSHRAEGLAYTRNADAPLVPETISVTVTNAAFPYECGDILTLSFVDPAVARIHARSRVEANLIANGGAPKPERTSPVLAPPAPAMEHSTPAAPRISFDIGVPEIALRAAPVPAALLPLGTSHAGVRFSLSWTQERVRRFIQVTDKLFTVDRLGWYRHAFAMRLLVPDEVSCGQAAADSDAARHLRTLRSAALDTLGRPLIASFMPTFEVTPAWLDTIDTSDAAKAVFGLREAIAPFASDEPAIEPVEPGTTVGIITAEDLSNTPAGSIEAFLPFLIANVSAFDDVTDRLTAYRRALIDLFGGTAESAETVRLGQMAQPNHTLDDRLWQLVGTIGERFGGLAVA